MSLDLSAVRSLALKLYVSSRESPREFKELSRSLLSLHITLDELQTFVEIPDSILLRTDTKNFPKLELLIAGTREALEELEEIYEKYPRLEGPGNKISWTKLKAGKENIDGIRDKLEVHLRTIQLFLTSVNGDSLDCVERKLEEKTEALHRLEEKVDIILGKFKQETRAPNPQPSGPTRQLGDLVSALKDDGVSAEALDRNFDFISALVLYQGNTLATCETDSDGSHDAPACDYERHSVSNERVYSDSRGSDKTTAPQHAAFSKYKRPGNPAEPSGSQQQPHVFGETTFSTASRYGHGPVGTAATSLRAVREADVKDLREIRKRRADDAWEAHIRAQEIQEQMNHAAQMTNDFTVQAAMQQTFEA